MEFTLTAERRQGRFRVRGWNRFLQVLKTWRDGEYTVTIARKHATRSVDQNRLYWGVYVRTLSDYTGYSPDEMHEVLKAKFLPKRLAIADGNGEVQNEFVIGGSTTKLNVIEFGDYLAAIHDWAAQLGCVFPELDDRIAS
jgi:hypothetical protein